MIEQNICFVVVYLAEALTAWQFFGELFSPRRPTWVRGILFGVGYGLAWLCFALDFVHVNVLIFAVCTGLILYIGYTVGIGKAALYAVLLSALMLGTEYLSMLFLGAFFDGFGQYKICCADSFCGVQQSALLYLHASLRSYCEKPGAREPGAQRRFYSDVSHVSFLCVCYHGAYLYLS